MMMTSRPSGAITKSPMRCWRSSADMIILGLDPGLACTGWGVIAAEGNRLTHVANGQIRTDAKQALPARLVRLEEELGRVIEAHGPGAAACEEVFLNENPH